MKRLAYFWFLFLLVIVVLPRIFAIQQDQKKTFFSINTFRDDVVLSDDPSIVFLLPMVTEAIARTMATYIVKSSIGIHIDTNESAALATVSLVITQKNVVQIVEVLTDTLTDIAAVVHAAMRYEQLHVQEASKLFCSNCCRRLCHNEFLEAMLKTSVAVTIVSTLIRNENIDIENDVTLKPQFEELKQLFVAGNSHDLVVFMLNALDKKKIANLSCSVCGSYAWKCAAVKPSIIVSSLQDNLEVCRS